METSNNYKKNHGQISKSPQSPSCFFNTWQNDQKYLMIDGMSANLIHNQTTGKPKYIPQFTVHTPVHTTTSILAVTQPWY